MQMHIHNRRLRQVLKYRELYIMLLLPITWYLIFHYIPMYGVQIAFKEFDPAKGFLSSPGVGFKHFNQFFSSYYFPRLIKNTILLSFYNILFGFPAPIILALIINEIRSVIYKKALQNITYIPHFLSTVVVVGMIYTFLDPRTGIVNIIIMKLGGEPIPFMLKPEWFRFLFVASGIWQESGWSSIIYIAALVSIDPNLYEAAIIDGSSRLQRIRYISIPSIMPTIVILFILRMGHIMNISFEKALLMQTDLNATTSDILQTYIYRLGIIGGRYSFTTAVGLFNSAINFTMLLLTNRLAKWKGETSLW